MVQQKKMPNKLDSPLFWVGLFNDFILITSGGGGKNYGLPNDVKVYRNQYPVKDVVDSLDFDTELLSHFEFAYNGLNYFIASLSKYLVIFEINPENGKLTQIKKLQADFHEKSPEVTKSKWSKDNKFVIWGGEEGIIRMYSVVYENNNIITGFELDNEFGAHSEGINDISINSDSSMVASSSVDKTWRIYSVKTGKWVKKLSFSEGIGVENLQFKGILFSPDSKYLYTLATKFKGRSYLIKWDAKDENFNPIDTTPAHTGPSWIMNINSQGNNIAIGTNDGFVVGVNADTMTQYRSEKKHKMPVSSIIFSADNSKILTTSADYTYWVINNNAQSSLYQKFVYLCFVVLLLSTIYCLINKFMM